MYALTNIEICLNICNVDNYKDTDDAFEVNIIDSIQLYQKEAVETQLSSIEKLVNLNGKLSRSPTTREEDIT